MRYGPEAAREGATFSASVSSMGVIAALSRRFGKWRLWPIGLAAVVVICAGLRLVWLEFKFWMRLATEP